MTGTVLTLECPMPTWLLCQTSLASCNFKAMADWPLKASCEQVHSECIMLMTRPCVDACRDSGPVQTSSVTMWNNKGRCDATENEHNTTCFILMQSRLSTIQITPHSSLETALLLAIPPGTVKKIYTQCLRTKVTIQYSFNHRCDFNWWLKQVQSRV